MEDNKLQHKSIETYAEDMAKVIETNEGGLIKKVIREQEEHEAQKNNLSPQSQRNRTFMFISVVLVVLSLGAVISIVVFRQQSFTATIAPQFTPIIFTDQSKFLEIGGLAKDKISQSVSNEVRATKVKAGGVEGIYITENKTILGLRKFLTLIEANLDQTKIIYTNDNFLMGVANKDTKSFFILVKMRSLPDIFDGLKSWENKMFYDLHGFFGVGISADTSYLLTKNFEDGIINNKNARILTDKNGDMVMAYTYVNDTSVVITNSISTVSEIILRLSAGTIAK